MPLYAHLEQKDVIKSGRFDAALIRVRRGPSYLLLTGPSLNPVLVISLVNKEKTLKQAHLFFSPHFSCFGIKKRRF